MTQNLCKHSQLCIKVLNRQDKPRMKFNRSPAGYDVIVKNNSKDEEKSLTIFESKTFR